MGQDTGHVALGDGRQVVLGVVLAPKHVVTAPIEQRLVQEHGAGRLLGDGLGHEGRVDAGLKRLQADDVLGGHDSVGHGERLGMAKRDAVLGATGRMEGVLHRHAHLLEHENGGATQVARGIGRSEVEIANIVQRLGRGLVREVVELDLGAHVHDVAVFLGLLEHTAQTLARIAGKRLAVRRAHVAEDAGDPVMAGAPGQDLERGGIGEREHIGLVGRGKALDGRAVETDALFECDLEVLWRDCEALKPTENIGKPKANEANIAFLDCAEHEVDVLLQVHGKPFHAVCANSAYTLALHCAIALFPPDYPAPLSTA